MQNTVNRLCVELRKQVVTALILEDRRKFGAPALNKNEMEWTCMKVFMMPVPTKRIRRLFNDAHEMQDDKGMIPHAANVGELEWCLKNRSVGYECTTAVKYGWLPSKEDADLRTLPAFIELKNVYINEKKVIAPTIVQIGNDDTARIMNQIQLKQV